MALLPPGVVWLASYPKSGNTWVRLLFSNLLSGRETPEDINDLTLKEEIAASRNLFEEEFQADSDLLTLAEIERLRPAVHDGAAAERTTPGLIKVHDAYVRLDDGAPLLGRATRAAVYIVRDPRDVVVSYACHQDQSIDRTIRQMNDPAFVIRETRRQIDHRLLDWSSHVRSWRDQRDTPVHLIRYEDLLADTGEVFARALDFLGVSFDDDELAHAVRHASFDALQRQEVESGFKERMSKSALFFRAGRAGGWRDRLTAEQVREIERAHGPTMTEMGYSLTTP